MRSGCRPRSLIGAHRPRLLHPARRDDLLRTTAATASWWSATADHRQTTILRPIVAPSIVIAGELPERYGSTVFLDRCAKADLFATTWSTSRAPPRRPHGRHPPDLVATITELSSPAADERASRFGVVYQDPGRNGFRLHDRLHADWQARPPRHLPSTRSLPSRRHHPLPPRPPGGARSHRWATPRRPQRQQRPGSGGPDQPRVTRLTSAVPRCARLRRSPSNRGPTPAGGRDPARRYLWHLVRRPAPDDVAIRRQPRGPTHPGDPDGAASGRYSSRRRTLGRSSLLRIRITRT